MTDLPLTATDLEIHRRLSAGHPIPHIVHVGWWKRSWSHADVLRVAEAWQQLATRNTEDNVRAEQRACPEPEGAVQLPVRLTIACEHIVCGWTDDEIARALHVAPKTATRYRRMVAGALGVPVRDIAAAIHSGRISVQGVAA